MGSRSPPTQGTLHPACRSGDVGVTGQPQARAIKWAARSVCPRGGGRAGLRTLQKPIETPVASKANVPVHETPSCLSPPLLPTSSLLASSCFWVSLTLFPLLRGLIHS